MPSRADGRVLAERVARAVALLALGALVWRRWEPRAPGDAPLRVSSANALSGALARATSHTVGALSLEGSDIPARVSRDWLDALAAAGTRVTWRAPSERAAIAASVDAIAAPDGSARVAVRAAQDAPLTISDRSGLVDSTTVGRAGVRVVAGNLQGSIDVRAPGVTARLLHPDSLVVRPILILARAGWEGKFVVAALEEAGWRVEPRFAIAPGAQVTAGTAGAIDTARFSAVVALDETAAASAGAIARFVRAGGGAVVAGGGLTLPALASLSPARAGAALSPSLGALAGNAPRRALAAVALRPASDDAVVLERRDGAPVVVAARAALGRIAAVGYSDTWRWRMQGGEGSDAAHRAWWSALVSSVAYAPAAPQRGGRDESVSDPAPYAAMVAALGPPAPAAEPSPMVPPARTDALLFAIALTALLAEWGSRRTRGAR